jgi:hypothetical protein
MIGRFIGSRVDRVRDRAARAMLGPMLVRLVLWLSGVFAIVVGFPFSLLSDPRYVIFALLAGAVPALWPRIPVVSVLLFTVVVGFVLSGASPAPQRVIAVAALIYLVHTGAALAAVLPYDAVVAPVVLVGWLVRAFGVITATVVIAVGLSVLKPWTSLGGSLVASIVGVVLACVAVYLLSRFTTRPRNLGE